MKEPLLSVIVPVYNTEKFFKRCIDSINSQTYRNIEIVVVNDGSEDGIDGMVPKQDNLKYVKHEKNLGLFRARVTGFENSSGEYVCFLDSDDYVSPDFYRTMMSKAVSDGIDIVAGDTVFVKSDGSKYKRNNHESNFGDAALSGDAVKEAFFSQEMSCFVWHTIWNKIYKRELWDKCVGEFRKVDRRLVMTEDILFSSILFYNAESFLYVQNEGYCYCDNITSSTNNVNSNFKKFESDISDIGFVFDFVEGYLKNADADFGTREMFRKGREHYSRIWRSYQSGRFGHTSKSKKSTAIMDGLTDGYEEKADECDHFFEILETKYDSSAEKMKNLIIDAKCKTVSFDVFDTLIVRPFYKPSDLFILIDGKYPGFGKFSKLRTDAENELRAKWHEKHDSDDFTLSDIYGYIAKTYSVPESTADELRRTELEYELRYCTERRFGKQLFELAKYLGKKIVLTSDMYLDIDTVEKMLDNCGYSGYDKLFLSSEEKCLKYDGKLYEKMIKYVGEKPENIVHIGDDPEKDCLQSKKMGIASMQLPKTTGAFMEKTNYGKRDVSGTLPDVVDESPVFRTMLAMASAKMFDNPFVSYSEDSDYNGSAENIGYCTVGMHLMGICKWIDDVTSESGIEYVSFLSRDGFLVKDAFDMYPRHGVSETNYVCCSRRCLMPWMVDSVSDLYGLPINCREHTPNSICSLLDFCMDFCGDDISDKDMKFKSEGDYHERMHAIFEKHFSISKLEKSKDDVRKYYRSEIKEGSAVFDLGYSGCIPAALSRALGYPVTFLYLGKNEPSCTNYENKFELDIRNMYGHIPILSDFIREYILSENGNMCIGFKTVNEKIEPVFEKDTDVSMAESYVLKKMQKSALDFVRDYCKTFSGESIMFAYDPIVVSLPFEDMLGNIKDFDRYLFKFSYSEDMVYNNSEKVSLYEHWCDYLLNRHRDIAEDGAKIVIKSYGIHDTIVINSPIMLKMYKILKSVKSKFRIGI